MPREAANRYEWPCPGDLLHIDVKSYPRFDAPGHAITGDRARPGRQMRKHLGQDYAHAAVDDHSRLAFSELYTDERSPSVVQFVEHALAFYGRHGIVTPTSVPVLRTAGGRTPWTPRLDAQCSLRPVAQL
jgi:Integrase core domain